MDPIIIIDSVQHSSNGTAYTCADCPIEFKIVSGITDGILVTYEWYLTRNNITTLVGIGSGCTLSHHEENDDIFVRVINCGGTNGINGTSGTSGIIDSEFTQLDDYQIIMYSGNTWRNSKKLILPGSFYFDTNRGIISYETPEDGHYEIVIFGDEYSGLTNVLNGDSLVYYDGNWINKHADCYDYINFYFNNTISNIHYIDIKASFNYIIDSIILSSSSGDTIQILIDNNPVTWIDITTKSSLNIDDNISEYLAYSGNSVSINNSIVLSGISDNHIIQGKIKILKGDCISIPSGITTTMATTMIEPTTNATTMATTTAAPTTTNATTIEPTTTITTTIV